MREKNFKNSGKMCNEKRFHNRPYSFAKKSAFKKYLSTLRSIIIQTNLHLSKLLRKNTRHFGFNFDGNFIGFDKCNNVVDVYGLSNLKRPFDDRTLYSSLLNLQFGIR